MVDIMVYLYWQVFLHLYLCHHFLLSLSLSLSPSLYISLPVYPIYFCAIHSILFCYPLFKDIPIYSTLFDYFLVCSTLFYSNLFSSILISSDLSKSIRIYLHSYVQFLLIYLVCLIYLIYANYLVYVIEYDILYSTLTNLFHSTANYSNLL